MAIPLPPEIKTLLDGPNYAHLATLTLIGVQAGSSGSVSVVNGTLIFGNPLFGVLTDSGAFAHVEGIVENNGDGLHASHGGSLRLTGAGRSRNNSRFGAMAGGGALTLSNGARVHDNAQGGILVISGGRLLAQTASLIEDNTGFGVEVVGGGVASFSGGSSVAADGVIIRNNTGDGVHVRDVSVAEFFPIGDTPVGATVVTNNGGFGIVCDTAPAVAQIRGSPGTVAGNGAGQVACPIGP